MSKTSNHQLIIRACTSLASATLSATIFLAINTNNVKASVMPLPVQSNVEKNVNQANHVIDDNQLSNKSIISKGIEDQWNNVNYKYDDITKTLTIYGGTLTNPLPVETKFFDESITKINILGKLTLIGDVSGFFGTRIINSAFGKSLTSIDGMKNINTSQATNMSHMFCDDVQLQSIDVSSFDTSQVTNMGQMFSGCVNLSAIDVRSFDTSQVTNMAGMFLNCANLPTIDVSSFDTSQVTSMSAMFENCSAANTIDCENFITNNVTNMEYMFSNCKSIKQLNLNSWNVSNVTDMDTMFAVCTSLTSLEVSKWKTDKLIMADYLFYSCKNLKRLDVSNWNTKKVASMSQMFLNCISLTKLDISGFDTRNIGNRKDLANAGIDKGPVYTPSLDDMLYGLSSLQELCLGPNINIAQAGLNTPVTWVSVQNGTVQKPKGTEFYSSKDLAEFWNDKNYTETWVRGIKYNININYVDLDDNNKVIQTDSISGNSIQPIDYKSSFDKIVADLKTKHYEYVANQDKLPWSNGKIQLPDDVTDNTTYTVGFKHATTDVSEGDKNPVTGDTITGLNKEIKQTIKYTGMPNNIADNVQTVKFTRGGKVDLVTGKVIPQDWNESEQSFKDVNSPTVTGYDANPSSIKGVTVTPDSSDITKTVTYVRSNYGIKINYVDGDDNNTILKTDMIEGNPEKTIAYKDKMNSIISSLTGYVLNKTKTDLPLNENGDVQLPADVLESKTYNVVLNHKTATMKPGDKNPVTGKDEYGLTKTITRTIKYTGSPNTISDKVQKATFTRNATVDLVTGKLTYLAWDNDSQTFAEVVSPKVNGYIADPETVNKQIVKPADNDTTVAVKYMRGNYNINIDYVDSNTGKVIKTDKVSGNPDKVISYQDQLKQILHDLPGYVIDKDKTTLPLDDNNDIKLPADVTSNKDYQVVLKHDSKTIHAGDKNPVTGKDEDSLTKTITQTIKYTGTPSPITDNIQKVTFERDADVDMVTGKLTYHDWKNKEQSFKDVTSPTVDGYDADIPLVKGTTVKPTDSDITKTVTYTKKEAPSYNITINYQDDNGNTVKTDKQKGKAGTTIQYHDQLQEIISQIGNGNYEIDKNKSNLPLDDNNDIKLPDDLTADHDYHIVLKHKTVIVKPGDKNPVTGDLVTSLTKEVKQVIKYTGTNKDIPDNVQTVKFTRNGKVDLVTGKVEYLDWDEKEQSFKDVDSPIVSGYTPDITAVKGNKVTADSNDIAKQVTYTKDKSDDTDKNDPDYEITIDYQDENGKTIKTDKQKGKANSTIPYKDRMQEIINSIAKNGYEVDWSKSNLPVDSNGNIKLGAITGDTSYKLVLKHKIVTFKYGEKNPFTGQEDPNLERKVTQTIKYLHSGKDLPNNVQELTFTRDAQVDMITGKVTYLEWHEGKQTFKDVESPFVKGYTPDLRIVKGRTVTGNSKDIVQLVTYHKSNIVQTGLDLTRNKQTIILGTIVAALVSLLSYFGIVKKKGKKDN